MFFSIIMPVYNSCQYLEAAINSVLTQNFDNWELIVVDDGSTDSSLALLQRFQAIDSRVKVFSQNNQGSAMARNRALTCAKGEYVCFLDSDDFWMSNNCLTIIHDAIIETGAMVLGTFYNSLIMGSEEVYPKPLHRDLVKNTEGRWVHFAEEQNPYYYWSYVYNRQFLVDKKVVFPNLRRYQDPPFLAKVLCEVEKYFVIPLEWYCYRVSPKEKHFSSRAVTDLFKGMLEVVLLAKKYNYREMIDHELMYLNNDTRFFDAILEGNIEALQYGAEIVKICGGDVCDILHFKMMKEAINESALIKKKQFHDLFSEARNIYIYGAGAYGTLVYDKIKKYGFDKKIYFVVSHNVNSKAHLTRPLLSVDELHYDPSIDMIIIAANNEKTKLMQTNLKERKIENYHLLTSFDRYIFWENDSV